MNRQILTTVILGAVILTGGCSRDDSMSSLHAYVAAGPKIAAHIPPLPPVPIYSPTAYSNPASRDPFTSFSELLLRREAAASAGTAPVRKSPLQPLEKYALGSLTLTGIVQASNGRYWGVFLTPGGKIYRAGEGDGIGNKNGHIVDINAANRTVTVLQYLPNAFGGFQKSTTTVRMQSPT